MTNRPTSLISADNLREQQKNVIKAGDQASEHIDRHIIRRWGSVAAVRRHVIVWLLLVSLIAGGLFVQNRQLAGFYRRQVYLPGGTFSEAIVGDLSNINPIFSTGLVDTSLSRLVFAGLLKYDDQNHLVGDLAESYAVNEKGTEYTVKLRPGLRWQDGEPLTAKDVAFTFHTIQHPDTRSSLNQSWQLIKIVATDDRTVVFTLPVSLTAFPQSLTTGLIPEHILGKVQASQLRSHPFNIKQAVGAGPFKIGEVVTVSLTSKQINLVPSDSYYAGKPKLDQFSVHTYPDQDSAVEAFRTGDVQAVAGGNFIDRPDIGSIAANVFHDPLTNGVFAFFKTSASPLNSTKLRGALLQGYNATALRQGPLQNARLPLEGPLLQLQMLYGPDLRERGFNKAEAIKLLEEDGWKLGADNIRVKDGKQLLLHLVTQNTTEYSMVASDIQKQWSDLGVKLSVDLVSEQDLQQNHIVPHNYDILLYGISLGLDPDTYAYWHSREAGLGGFNLSEYKSSGADASLEAGRTRTDPVLRAIKYKGFLGAWRDDAPAVALYQSGFDYLQTVAMSGFSEHTLVSPADRYNNVANWMVQARIKDK